MDELSIPASMSDLQKQNIAQTIKDYGSRLFAFIKQRVSSREDAEDILQDVFFQLVGNTSPIDQMTAWLFATARNKITDSYRKKKTQLIEDLFGSDDDEEFSWDEIMLDDDSTPETEYMRAAFWTTLYEALDELPAEQRDAFVAHELNDVSFEALSKETGVPVPTLISRKRYAVLHLRRRLQILKEEFLNY